jgi:ribonuclease R
MDSETIAEQILRIVYAEGYRPTKPKGLHKSLKLADEAYRELRRAIKKLVREGRLVFGSNHLVLRPDSPAAPASKPSAKPAFKPAAHASRPKLQSVDIEQPEGIGLSTSPANEPEITDEPEIDDEIRDDLETVDEDTADDSNDEHDLATEESGDGVASPKGGKRSKELVGVFRIAPTRQFGFVKLPKIAGKESEDEVFIPPRFTKNAMDGDTVRVRVTERTHDRTVGKVVEIVARGRREFAGTFKYIDSQAVVWLDGANLGHPVNIGDVRGLPVEENDKIIVELVRFPDFFQPGEAVIMKVLGSNKNPAVDTAAVMYQFGLPEEFPDNAIEVARAQADLFDDTVIPEDRVDLTGTTTVTIDPFDARDFDDAISLTKNEKGNWELQVHIADVSHFVPVGSALDIEAQRRATSVYLPDRVIPMIPEIISNHLASLQPDKNRLAKTVFMEFSPAGVLLYKRVFNSVIRNHYRFNYEQIDHFLANREEWREKLTPEVYLLVERMHELAMMLRRRRSEQGALELVLPEVKIDLDKSGKVKGAHLVHHTESHQVIEEFMLAANEAVASWLDELGLPFLRRAHAPPNRLKLRQLNQFVNSLGIESEDLESRFEIQRVVNSVRGLSTEYAVNYAILKSMSKAVYQASYERHYALNMSHYCHFTSPIRRYPDLVVHRIVQKLIMGEPAKEDEQVLERLGEHCSAMEQNAEAAERELIKVKLLHFLSKKRGELLSGVVAGVKSVGLTVRATEIPVDGFIRTEDLPPDRYRFSRDTHSLEGFRSGNHYRLGDEVIVRIKSIDMVQRQLLFELEKITRSVPLTGLGKRSDRARGSKGHKSFDKKSTQKKRKRNR